MVRLLDYVLGRRHRLTVTIPVLGLRVEIFRPPRPAQPRAWPALDDMEDDHPRVPNWVPVPFQYPIFLTDSEFQDLLQIQDEVFLTIRTENVRGHELNVAGARELKVILDDIEGKSQAVANLQEGKEVLVNELIQKGLELEAEVLGLDSVKAEIVELKSEVQKLDSESQEMSTKVHDISQDLKLLQAENQWIPAMKQDVDSLRELLLHVRNAFEYENKVHAELLEERNLMENNLVSMSLEIEKLQAGYRSPVLGDYGVPKTNCDMGDQGTSGVSYGSEIGLHGSGPSYELCGAQN